MADGLDSYLPEIIDCQTRQHLKVDSVVQERLLIGLQAESAQPFSDVQLRLRGPLSRELSSFIPVRPPIASRKAERSGSTGTGCPDRTWPSASRAGRSSGRMRWPRDRFRHRA